MRIIPATTDVMVDSQLLLQELAGGGMAVSL